MVVFVGIAFVASIAIFPESVSHQFRLRFLPVIQPLTEALTSMEELFAHIPRSQGDEMLDWTDRAKQVRAQLISSLAGIPPLRAQQRYLYVDISFGRLSSKDLRSIFEQLSTVQVRSGGLAFYFDVLYTNARHSHLDSSAFTVRDAQVSRPGSARNSVDGGLEQGDSHHRNHLTFLHRLGGSGDILHSHRGSHTSLLDSWRTSVQPVGLYESQKYMDLEKVYFQ
jgi:hypothetical protein